MAAKAPTTPRAEAHRSDVQAAKAHPCSRMFMAHGLRIDRQTLAHLTGLSPVALLQPLLNDARVRIGVEPFIRIHAWNIKISREAERGPEQEGQMAWKAL